MNYFKTEKTPPEIRIMKSQKLGVECIISGTDWSGVLNVERLSYEPELYLCEILMCKITGDLKIAIEVELEIETD